MSVGHRKSITHCWLTFTLAFIGSHALCGSRAEKRILCLLITGNYKAFRKDGGPFFMPAAWTHVAAKSL